MTMDEMLTPTDIQKHLKIGRNKTYQLIQLSSFPNKNRKYIQDS